MACYKRFLGKRQILKTLYKLVGVVVLLSLFLISINWLHSQPQPPSSSKHSSPPTSSSTHSPPPADGIPPGVIVHPTGGIGNQLFIFACQFALSRQLNWPLYYHLGRTPVSRLRRRNFQSFRRDFVLDQFNVPPGPITDAWTKLGGGIRAVEERDVSAFASNRNVSFFVHLPGYCIQNLEFWARYAPDLKRMAQVKMELLNLSPPVESLLHSIQNSESVAIHVRIREPKKGSNEGPVYKTYYPCAIRKLRQLLGATRNLTFFVFSDNYRVARRSFPMPNDINVVHVSEHKTNSIEDFYLMTQCKHFIIPVSTFSWWAAFVGGGNGENRKTVISLTGIKRNNQMQSIKPPPGEEDKWIYIKETC